LLNDPPVILQVRDWIKGMGVENIGKRLINSREGAVEFDKPTVRLALLVVKLSCMGA
jgi:hypothetical protein